MPTCAYSNSFLSQIILLLGNGPDTSRRSFLLRRHGKVEENSSSDSCQLEKVFSWRPVMLFILWTIMWSAYVLLLCGVSVKQYGGLWEMFTRYQQNLVYIYSIYVYIYTYLYICISFCSTFLGLYAKTDQ